MNEITLFFNNLDFNWSIIESTAVFFSILYVILAVKESVWCWGAAVISVILYIYICYTEQLYPETGLQVFYLLMALYGYHQWNKNDSALKIQQWKTTRHLLILLLGALLTFLMGFYFTIYTNAAMPLVDSFTTVFSVFTTYMVTKKVLRNWLYWIVIDIVSVYLYFSRDLHLTSLLFIVYTVIAIFGYFSWIKRNNELT
ncbi:MAG: nicotinamide mononucleotide transporter [Flavobacteriales bacterium]|jgi:nicotinamide mononucleotide transporter|nr:nicotinamide mononucleotide transporter [Flavobacteriales bacterium]MBT5089589.1 nicotinamide mononucleotide transporter [Flavobacteriales bacterium]MBT5749542.1 nicotinamide mononucleotide transporter [Flavobacteriales bacterium]